MAADASCRTKNYAAWATAVLTVAVQIAAISYGYGKLEQRQIELDHRVTAVEVSNRDQDRQIGDSGARLARIEEGILYIRDSLKDHQKATEKK